MSRFEQNWPTEPADLTLEAQRGYIQDGLTIIRSRLILPEDDRWDIAYGMLVQGGGQNSVIAQGDPGTGKTEFGNIVLDASHRVDIDAGDRAASLEGYVNPINRNEWIPGKVNLDTKDTRFFLNEVGHLGNTGPLHKYWDGEKFYLAGNPIDTSDAVFYSTTNYPDMRRTKELDDAFRDRQGILVVTGDATPETVVKILGREGRSGETGLLPSPRLRRFIRETMVEAAPVAPSSAVYMHKVVERINQSGLVSPNVSASGRLGSGWRQAVRASRLVDDKKELFGVISDEELMRVAPLALGAIATLGNQGSAIMEERLGYIDRPTAHERAVFRNRVVAAAAFAVYHEMHPTKAANGREILDMTNSLNLHAHLQSYSYANAPDAQSTEISQLLHAGVIRHQNLTKEPVHEPQRARSSTRRRA